MGGEPVRAFPGGVRALLESDLVTEATRAVLQARLEPGSGKPAFLDPHAYATLQAACTRLIPQPERAEPIDIAAGADARLASGEGDGWRYAAMPPDRDAYRLGLRGLDESARAMFNRNFIGLEDAEQDAVLSAVQRGTAEGETWRSAPSARFFEELLVELVECYYSHPLASDEIGYAGYADAHGWQHIGLGEREPWEPPTPRDAVRDADG